MAANKIITNELGEVQDLFAVRESVELTDKNAKFSLSDGGLVALDLTHDDGTVERFERVLAIRAFPISEPDEYISILEPDTKEKGKGAEIGFVRNLNTIDQKARALINDELARRYFTPEVKKIYSVKEKFGYSYFDCDTSAGRINFVMNNPTGSIRTLEDGRVFIYDIDGNCFTVTDPTKLDRASFHKIELYL